MRMMRSCCARSATALAGERGSLVTVAVCAYVVPFTVNLNVYTPGKAIGPSGDAGVRPGLALISNECENAGGGSYRKSQLTRLSPTAVGIGAGLASQKLGSGGSAASRTGVTGALERWRTTAPDASRTSSVMSPCGAAASV